MYATDHGALGSGQPGPTASDAVESTRQRILRAAADLFGQQGYARATTRVIAAAAGVNEVTLFRHFGSKLNLFMALVTQYSGLPDLEAMMDSRFTGDYRQDMHQFGCAFQALMAERRSSIRLLLCESEQIPELRAVVGQMPVRLRKMVAGYLRSQIAAGRVRPLDPEVMAQAFLGMFFAYNLSELLVPETLANGTRSEDIVELFVDVFVSGTIDQRCSSLRSVSGPGH